MNLLTPEQRATLLAHASTLDADPCPVVKFFNPAGPQTWLATELDADGDTLFGLADLGFGCPEMGSFSLREIEALRLPFGLTIERDRAFATPFPLSVWADTARRLGSIIAAEQQLIDASVSPLPSPPDPASGEDG
jgi:hypothetical protein